MLVLFLFLCLCLGLGVSEIEVEGSWGGGTDVGADAGNVVVLMSCLSLSGISIEDGFLCLSVVWLCVFFRSFLVVLLEACCPSVASVVFVAELL